MNNHKSIYIFFGILLIGSIGIGLFVIFQQFGAGSSAVNGRVYKVINRSSTTADEYYAISVQAANGHEYTIDATASQKNSNSPAQQEETCIDIPRVSIGDKVSFILPRSTSYANTYVTCYDKATSGYYFTIH